MTWRYYVSTSPFGFANGALYAEHDDEAKRLWMVMKTGERIEEGMRTVTWKEVGIGEIMGIHAAYQLPPFAHQRALLARHPDRPVTAGDAW